jgi:hypothetical protein
MLENRLCLGMIRKSMSRAGWKPIFPKKHVRTRSGDHAASNFQSCAGRSPDIETQECYSGIRCCPTWSWPAIWRQVVQQGSGAAHRGKAAKLPELS